jgi:hypothetical protein
MDFAETMRILFSIKPRYSFILVSLIMSSASIAESLKQKQASLDQKSHQLEVYRKKTHQMNPIFYQLIFLGLLKQVAVQHGPPMVSRKLLI